MSKKLITRTVKASEITVMCVDTECAEVVNRTITHTGAIKDERAALRIAAASIDEPNLKIVQVVNIATTKQLYRITEEDFLAHAVVINC